MIDSWGALLVRSRDGDQLAFEELVRACERRVLTIAYQITGNLSDAQDVAQESFLRVYRSRDRFQDGRSFEAWLYRIVVNQARRSLSRGRRHRADSLEDAPAGSLPVDTAPDPHEQASAGNISDTMMVLLEELPPRLRSVFVLRDLQGMETAEISRILNCAEGTVRRHSAEGRIRIRRLLEERHPGIQKKK
jgi:RNA polymerase sigma-70 factor (ECF subfamily)